MQETSDRRQNSQQESSQDGEGQSVPPGNASDPMPALCLPFPLGGHSAAPLLGSVLPIPGLHHLCRIASTLRLPRTKPPSPARAAHPNKRLVVVGASHRLIYKQKGNWGRAGSSTESNHMPWADLKRLTGRSWWAVTPCNFFSFLLAVLGWQGLLEPCGFQAYDSVTRRLHPVLTTEVTSLSITAHPPSPSSWGKVLSQACALSSSTWAHTPLK